MVKHNNVIPNQHFKKKWQFYVRTWFNQPARKVRRRKARAEKAARIFPRPAAGMLRPIVHGQTLRYGMKKRLGKGFTLAELKEAGIPTRFAPTVGIAVDHRRRNLSLEGFQENVNRLKTYKTNLVVFPRNAKKPKAGDSTPEELATVQQYVGAIMPIKADKPTVEFGAITEDMKKFQAYAKLRIEKTNARLAGKRAKRKAEEEAAEKQKLK